MGKIQKAADTKSAQGELEFKEPTVTTNKPVDLEHSNAGKEVGKVTMTEAEKEAKLAAIDHTLYTSYPGVNKEMIEILRKTVCKDFTMAEIYFYLNICQDLGMSPYLKLLWGWKEKDKWDKDWIDPADNAKKGRWIPGAAVIFAGRDGYVYNAERNRLYRGLESHEIRKNDIFKPDFANNKVMVHTPPEDGNRGETIGAWAVCYRHNAPDRLTVIYKDDYYKDSWKNIPAMCKKVAETEACKKQFPLPGIQSEYDWELTSEGRAVPREFGTRNNTPEDNEKQSYAYKLSQLLVAADAYVGPNKKEIVANIRSHIKHKTLTSELMDEFFAMFNSSIEEIETQEEE